MNFSFYFKFGKNDIKFYQTYQLINLHDLFVVPDNGPATITISVVSSSVANVSWTPVPPEIRNGIILGYFVSFEMLVVQVGIAFLENRRFTFQF